MDPYFPGGSARGENVCFCFVLFCVCVFCHSTTAWMLNTLRPRQNGGRFADDILDCVLLNENVWISIKISLKFLPKGPINNIPALIPIMTWRRPGDKPLSGRIYAPLGPNELKIWIIIFFLHCTIYSLPVHTYRWCMYSFLSFNPYFCLLYRHFAIGDHYAPKHNLLNIVMLNSLAIYSNLKLLINFLFCIIQKRAIKFWGEHFSIRIKHGSYRNPRIKFNDFPMTFPWPFLGPFQVVMVEQNVKKKY